MVERRRVDAGRQRGAPLLGKALLEAGDRLAGAGVARRHDAAGAGVDQDQGDATALGVGSGADAAGAAVERVLPERRHAADLDVGAEAGPRLPERQIEPAGDGVERGRGHQRRPRRVGVVGEAGGRILEQAHRGGQPPGHPVLERRQVPGQPEVGIVDDRGRGVRIDLRADAMNGRELLAVDEPVPTVHERPAAVSGQRARGQYGRRLDRDGVETFDGVEVDAGNERSRHNPDDSTPRAHAAAGQRKSIASCTRRSASAAGGTPGSAWRVVTRGRPSTDTSDSAVALTGGTTAGK